MATLTRRKFTVAEYYEMAEAGILGEDDRVELIEGEIVEMAPIGSLHTSTVARLTELLSDRFASQALVWVQNPVHLTEFSEPQPDLALLTRRDDFYASAHPSPGDVLLVIEVTKASADYDRGVKAPLYASAGIQELWIVDLNASIVEIHRQPRRRRYSQVNILEKGESVSPLAFPDTSLAVADMLP